MKKILISLVRFYKSFISPLYPPRCRFTPTCSSYMEEAITKYGAFKGVFMGIKRLLRCHPFCKGGYDPLR